MFGEHGPFHVNLDGKTLFENAFSWNKVANVLYLETPIGVGFSYGNASDPTVQATHYNDEAIAATNLLALLDFFSVYPEYAGRPFYVAGESYGGVFAPTLVQLMVRAIKEGSIPGINLAGLVVGNGLLSTYTRIASDIGLLYHRGFISKVDWDWLWSNCCADTVSYQQAPLCNFTKYITLANETVLPVDNSECARRIAELTTHHAVTSLFPGVDIYNTYQDCYRTPDANDLSWAAHSDPPSALDSMLQMHLVDPGRPYVSGVVFSNFKNFPSHF